MQYLKKVVPVDAIQIRDDNLKEAMEFTGERLLIKEADPFTRHLTFKVETPHGIVSGIEGDYVLKDIQGHLYPCAQETFIRTYEPFVRHNLTFGQAIELAKSGSRIARKGWNGKGMFVVYQKGYPDGIPCNKNTAEAFGYEEGTLFRCRPYLQMRCADGSHQMWVASQSDILEDDWFVLA